MFLLEGKELVAKVFDGHAFVPNDPDATLEIRIPANQGIAGHVATTGQSKNHYRAKFVVRGS